MNALRAHAVEAYPQECIGYIDDAGCYARLRNVAADPNAMAVAPARQIATLIASGRLRALCHSHPDGPDCPSETDMLLQIEMEVPFIIVSTNGQASAVPFAWGDQLDTAPLIGRPFRHGVQDCYAAVRDWYRIERGVVLPDYARNWEWWREGAGGSTDLYRRYFADAGFRRIDPVDVREGDVWLAAIKSEVPNHAGVVLTGGLALHHPSSGLAHDPSRLSKREPIARWLPYIRGGGDYWLRRDVGAANGSSPRPAG